MVRDRAIRLGLGLAMLGGLAACDTLGNPFEVLAKKRPGPDEFQVLARRPLQMPATTALPVPRPGEVSRLEPNPNQEAVAALLGPGAVPRTTVSSAGEQELLSAANAAAAEPSIREQLASGENLDDPNKPYEPPSLFSFVLDDGGEIDRGELLDPNAEARRLQTDGVAAAPINPADKPKAEVPTGTGPSGLFYDTTTTGGRPNNKLPVEGTKPAFE